MPRNGHSGTGRADFRTTPVSLAAKRQLQQRHLANSAAADVCSIVRSRLFWAGHRGFGSDEASGSGDDWLPELHGHQAERERLAEALRRTVELGESNSLLVVGPRGCGKTLLVETGLRDAGLQPTSGAAAAATAVRANVVRLSGLLETDEQLALAELARQLRLDNVVDSGERLLGTHAEQQQFLLDALRSGDRQESRPIVAVLDEFDLFAQQRNQSLLYNLFDVAQSRQTPLCVIGVTCRLDVFELLEKRVKSRYSHRAIYMFDCRPYDDYERLFMYYLSVPAQVAHASPAAASWNRSVQLAVAGGAAGGGFADGPVRRELRQCHRVAGRDIRSLQRVAFLAMCNAVARCSANAGAGASGEGDQGCNETPAAAAELNAVDVLEAVKAAAADSIASTLRGVSVLELALLIAMRQLAELYDGEPFNFSMAYERYRAFYDRTSAGKACDRAVALKAFEHLTELELVQPATGGGGEGGAVPKEYRPVRLLVDGTQLAETLQTYTGCPTDLKQWAASAAMASG